ncbi:hypothetical protein D1841_17805, partial [Neglecta sp. X4]
CEFFREIFGVEGTCEQEIIQNGIAALERFIAEIGLSQRLEIEERDFAKLAEQTLNGRPFIGWGLAGLSAADIEKIYRKCLVCVA